MKTALAQLNAVEQPHFVAVCGPLFEHSPWIAERTWQRRPFASLTELHAGTLPTLNELRPTSNSP